MAVIKTHVMAELEKEKLELEINALQKGKARDKIKFWLDFIQGLSIIVGIFIAFNEFVLKDRESETQKSKVTLEYIQKAADKDIIAAKDSLKFYRDFCFQMPVKDSDNLQQDSIFNDITKRFEKSTIRLCHYYNILNEGIKSDYFNRKTCIAFLSSDVDDLTDILSEFQSRVGQPGEKSYHDYPNYKNFKGMIEFYILCFPDKAKKYKSFPQYDIDLPSKR